MRGLQPHTHLTRVETLTIADIYMFIKGLGASVVSTSQEVRSEGWVVGKDYAEYLE